MAVFRKIHVSFWKDVFIKKLTPEQKYFYLYLMTNINTTQCGIYEIDLDTISHDTGYNIETVKKLIHFFEDKGKIKYSLSTEEIAIKNWNKYNDSTSPKVKACVGKELKTVKNRVLIEYLYSIDTHTQKEEEKEEEKEKEKEKGFLPIKGFFLNEFDKDYQLSEIEVGKVIQFIKLKTQKDLTGPEILDQWTAFKIDNFDKREWKNSIEDVISHFRNSLKIQTQKNATDKSTITGSGKKPGTSEARIAALRAWGT